MPICELISRVGKATNISYRSHVSTGSDSALIFLPLHSLKIIMKEFEQLGGLSPEVLRAIGELGFEKPTPIQEKSIPVLLSGEQDFVGLAQTGTGKTAAFGLPLCELVNFKSP